MPCPVTISMNSGDIIKRSKPTSPQTSMNLDNLGLVAARFRAWIVEYRNGSKIISVLWFRNPRTLILFSSLWRGTLAVALVLTSREVHAHTAHVYRDRR